MFFASQHSRHVQIGYELTKLRQERGAALERATKLELEITEAAAHDGLVEAARKLGLSLHGPARRD